MLGRDLTAADDKPGAEGITTAGKRIAVETEEPE
jgi:hypothetical protein